MVGTTTPMLFKLEIQKITISCSSERYWYCEAIDSTTIFALPSNQSKPKYHTFDIDFPVAKNVT